MSEPTLPFPPRGWIEALNLAEPIALHQVGVTVENVTNRPRENEDYPSGLRVNARLADDGEVARRVLLAGSGVVLAEDHVELAVEVVLHAPVPSRD